MFRVIEPVPKRIIYTCDACRREETVNGDSGRPHRWNIFGAPASHDDDRADICDRCSRNLIESWKRGECWAGKEQPAPPDAERLYRAAESLLENLRNCVGKNHFWIQGDMLPIVEEALVAYAQSRTAPPDAARTAYDAETSFRLLGLRAAAIHFMASVPPEYRETTAAKDLQYACKEGFGESPAARWAKKLRELKVHVDTAPGINESLRKYVVGKLQSLADEMENRP